MDHTVLRAPLYKRIMIAAGVTLEAATAVWSVTAGHTHTGGVVAAGVGTAVAASLGIRVSIVAVVVRDDELVVRNYLTTHHIPRGHIRGFDWGKVSIGKGKTIVVDTGMSTVPLDVMASWPRVSPSGGVIGYLIDWAGLR